MKSADLLIEIASAFPPMEMPLKEELPFHARGCLECQWLQEELDWLRGKPINGDLIRLLHQELSCLSAKAWRWIAPHYIRYCLTTEADYNQMEIEFLVYALGPEERFQKDVVKRLSLLDSRQIRCFILFVEYLADHAFWSEYFPENIRKAAEFLGAIERSREPPPPLAS